jgi:hypothetical protein
MSGSGKTSGPSATLAKAHLRAGYGGIFHAVKPDDPALALKWCQETGRMKDVILFGPKHPTRFNFLDHELQRSGDGAGLTENIANLLLDVSEIVDRRHGADEGGGENARFFAQAKKQILRVTIDVLGCATGHVTVPDIYEIIMSAPRSPEQFHSAQWRKTSFCYACLTEAAQRADASRAAYFKNDLNLAGAYWCAEFPQLSDRTRSSIVASVTGTIDTLNRGHLRQLFSEGTNFTPEALAEGKLLIHTMPVLEWGEVGAMAQVVMKYATQKVITRRNIAESPRPIFLHLDEFQALLTPADNNFATTCRSFRGAFILLSQTLPTVYAALGACYPSFSFKLLSNSIACGRVRPARSVAASVWAISWRGSANSCN